MFTKLGNEIDFNDIEAFCPRMGGRGAGLSTRARLRIYPR